MAFDTSAIVGQPFFAATLGLSLIGWLVAFISSCAAASSHHLGDYAWFAVFFELLLIIGIIMAIGTNSLAGYRFTILTFLAVGIVVTSLTVDANVHSHNDANNGVAAGHIILAMVNFVFVFVFGSDENTIISHTVSDLAVINTPYGGNSNGISGGIKSSFQNINAMSSRTPVVSGPSLLPMGSLGGMNGTDSLSTPLNESLLGLTTGTQGDSPPRSTGDQPVPPAAGGQEPYTYQAKALYAYEANPSDPNEISFGKNEILTIIDNSGKWWQAKRDDGTVGIVPSNYLTLL